MEEMDLDKMSAANKHPFEHKKRIAAKEAVEMQCADWCPPIINEAGTWYMRSRDLLPAERLIKIAVQQQRKRQGKKLEATMMDLNKVKKRGCSPVKKKVCSRVNRKQFNWVSNSCSPN